MKYLILLLFFSISIISNCQVVLLDKTYDYIQKGDLKNAINVITKAEKHITTANDARTHYLKSFIYKELYLKSDTSINVKNNYRNIAVLSLRKCKMLDISGSLTNSIKPLSNFLSASIYNDGIELFNNHKYIESIVLFKQYRLINESLNENWLMACYYVGSSFLSVNQSDSAKHYLEIAYQKNLIEPTLFLDLSYIYLKEENENKTSEIIKRGLVNFPDFLDLKIANLNFLAKFNRITELEENIKSFLKAYPNNIEVLFLAGSTFEKILRDSTNFEYFYKAENCYRAILSIDDLNKDANYNLGVLYYNAAVEIINNSSLETNIDELTNILEKSTKLFEQSLPYLTKIHINGNTDIKILKALQAIYYNLNMKEELQKITNEIEASKK